MSETLDFNEDTQSVLDRLAGEVPDEAPVFENLPPGAWCIGRTATKDAGNAGPRIRMVESKKPESAGQVFHFFEIGLSCMGGDGKVDSKKHNKKMCFFSSGVTKGPKEKHNGAISGRLTGFLNGCFATGVGSDIPPGKSEQEKLAAGAARAKARWAVTMNCLKKTAEEHPECSLQAYGGNYALLLGGLAVAALQEESRVVLFLTRKRSGGYEGVEVGSFEDYTPSNTVNRKVSAFEAGEDY
jgi:hypothetical protein